MSEPKIRVFISYRRADGFYCAISIKQFLAGRGVDVFLDVEDIKSGRFENVILEQIADREHFLVILMPESAKRFSEKGDLMRREIEYAIAHKCNVIPILAPGFKFKEAESYLDGNLSLLPTYNAITLYEEYFNEAMEKLIGRFLKVPHEVIKESDVRKEKKQPRSKETQKTSKSLIEPVSQETVSRATPDVPSPDSDYQLMFPTISYPKQQIIDIGDYPQIVIEDIIRLRRRIRASGLPVKVVDQNLLIGTWNIKSFGTVYPKWDENPRSPKRNLRALAYIAEILRGLDVVAIQEVNENLSGIQMLLERFLGSNWSLVVSSSKKSYLGKTEPLVFLFDKRRVEPVRMIGEMALDQFEGEDPKMLFTRPPYFVGFQSGGKQFGLLTLQIKREAIQGERLQRERRLANHTVIEILRQLETGYYGLENLILLGDFDIYQHADNPLFQSLVSIGLNTPPQIEYLSSMHSNSPKPYNMISWLMGHMELSFTDKSGVIDFVGAVYKEIPLRQLPLRLSNHLPLWVEFIITGRQSEAARVLGVDPDNPNPFDDVPD